MKRLWMFGLLVMAISGCGKGPEPGIADEHGHEEPGHLEGKVEISPEAQQIAGIEVVKTRFEEIQESIAVPGTVMSTNKGRAVVTPPVAGRVVSISVQLGDQVKQGQTLAQLESPELALAWSGIADSQRMRDASAAELQQANAEIGLSRAKLAAAKSSLARQQKMANAGAFSQAPIQQAQSDLADAQSELLSIQKEQASHGEQFRRLENLFRDGIIAKSQLEAARLELQQDQIRMERAKARVENAKITYNREKNIGSRGLLNAKEIQAAEEGVTAAQLELDRAKLKAKSAESALTSANRAIANSQAIYRSSSGSGAGAVGRVALVAPIAGTVTRLDVTRGQAVDRTQVLLEVENLSSVWVSANVPEADSAKVKRGAQVEITVASMPGRVFEGFVQLVGQRVDPKTRTVAAQCLITGSAGMLKPDMFANVRLGIGALSSKLVVPKSAIVVEGSESFVFVKVASKFEKCKVILGSTDRDRIAVESGISEGDAVATKGTFVISSELQKDELKGEGH